MQFNRTLPQKLPEETDADQRHPCHPEELCCLPEAEELAMVALVYQGELDISTVYCVSRSIE